MASFRHWIKSLTTPDKRGRGRHDIPPLVAYFWDGGQPVAHTVKDISATGFYLHTTERWLLGTLITMTLRRTYSDSDHPECSVAVVSKVVRHGQDGVGFAFIPMDAARPGQQPVGGQNIADRKALDRFLHLLREDTGYIKIGPALILLLIVALASLSSEAVIYLLALPFLWAATHATTALRANVQRRKSLISARRLYW